MGDVTERTLMGARMMVATVGGLDGCGVRVGGGVCRGARADWPKLKFWRSWTYGVKDSASGDRAESDLGYVDRREVGAAARIASPTKL